jgi:TonB family protein
MTCRAQQDDHSMVCKTSSAPQAVLGIALLALAGFFILAPSTDSLTSSSQPSIPAETSPGTPLKTPAAPVTIRRISPLVPSLLSSLSALEAPTPPRTASDLTADFDAYDKHITSLILRYWLPSRGTEASARIEFSIAPSGQVVRARITKPTGIGGLDAALRTLITELATIGKPLPATIEADSYQIEVELRAE